MKVLTTDRFGVISHLCICFCNPPFCLCVCVVHVRNKDFHHLHHHHRDFHHTSTMYACTHQQICISACVWLFVYTYLCVYGMSREKRRKLAAPWSSLVWKNSSSTEGSLTRAAHSWFNRRTSSASTTPPQSIRSQKVIKSYGNL